MSFLGDVLGFEKFNFKAMWQQIREDPERLFLGAADSVGSKVWGTILNKDWKNQPIVDQWGGASKYNYGRAEKAGVDIKAGHNMHQVARVIASIFTGGAAAGHMGGAGSAATSGTEGLMPLGEGAVPAGEAAQTGLAEPAAQAGAGTPVWQQWAQRAMNLQGGQQQPEPVIEQPDPVAPPDSRIDEARIEQRNDAQREDLAAKAEQLRSRIYQLQQDYGMNAEEPQ